MTDQRPETSIRRRYDHLVQLYTDDAFLAETVAEFLAEGLARGAGAMAIATPAHVEGIRARLGVHGIDVDAVVDAGQLLFLDAEQTLPRLLVDGVPDRAAFVPLVHETLQQLSGFPSIYCFGEMVNLLWGRDSRAAAALEELWNEVLADRSIQMLCAYRAEPFDRHTHQALHGILRSHSHVMPDQHREDFDEAVDRAYHEVFGVSGDASGLRAVIESRRASMPTMSPGLTALFALREVSPILADQLVDHGRVHYQRRRSART